MKEIPLTKGYVAIVDDDDYDELSRYKWHAVKVGYTVYARRRFTRSGRPANVHMHREIIDCPPGMVVDHVNRNGLDNRRENLRIASMVENNINRRMSQKNTTGFRGVSWDQHAKKYRATIKSRDSRSTYLGIYDDPIDAARAYDEAAVQHHGEFAQLNFPEEREAAS